MKRWLIVAALLLTAGISSAEPVEITAASCYGVDVASGPFAGDATPIVTSTVQVRSDGRWIRRATDGWQWVDVHNSTNSASIYIRYAIAGTWPTAALATAQSSPAISSSPLAGITYRGWKIEAGGEKGFALAPGQVIFARNDSAAGTTGVTVCARK